MANHRWDQKHDKMSMLSSYFCLLDFGDLGPVWIFFCHHSSLFTQFLSLITHYSSLKIPQFPNHTHLAHITQLLITHFSDFCGTHSCNLVSPPVKLTHGTIPHHFLFSHFPSPLLLSLFTLHSLPLSSQAQPSYPPGIGAHKLTSRSCREHR